MGSYRYKQGDRPLDGYTIEYALGRGGFGEVYFGLSDSGREVALKAVQNYEEVELRGISHCMNLKSPHLVTIFDVRHDDSGVPWVIMEYVSGPSLRDMLNDPDAIGGIGEDQALYFTRELIKGLRYLHDAGVVHRDLKPHNVFFEDGTVKIGDYSLSKAISNTHQTGHTTTVGSVHYMAPEIGQGKYDKAVDIYALGIILYEMLTGQPPYVGESMGEVLMKHMSSEPDVSGLSQPFARTIQKAMQRDPADRFKSVDELLRSLCPDDHSSYLPPPASLSMIGDRAAKQRVPVVAVSAVASPPQQAVDTSIPWAALVDTAETSDSQPFERPGIPKLSSKFWRGANQLGLWWNRTEYPLTSSDAVSFSRRAACAFGISAIVVGFSAACTPDSIPNLESLLFLAITLPIFGAVLTWLFLQILPRSSHIMWTVWSRILSIPMLMFATAMYWGIFSEFTRMRFDDDWMVGIFFLSWFIDWRCFISADRYPRVGVLKTMVAIAVFFLPVAMDNHPSPELAIATATVGVALVTIQLLAPHCQELPKEKQKPPKRKAGALRKLSSKALAMWKTRAESESFLVREEV